MIEAGADMFLMPSRFEPCGLNQMYSQRYGTPPIATATGGLVDTIVDYDASARNALTSSMIQNERPIVAITRSLGYGCSASTISVPS